MPTKNEIVDVDVDVYFKSEIVAGQSRCRFSFLEFIKINIHLPEDLGNFLNLYYNKANWNSEMILVIYKNKANKTLKAQIYKGEKGKNYQKFIKTGLKIYQSLS